MAQQQPPRRLWPGGGRVALDFGVKRLHRRAVLAVASSQDARWPKLASSCGPWATRSAAIRGSPTRRQLACRGPAKFRANGARITQRDQRFTGAGQVPGLALAGAPAAGAARGSSGKRVQPRSDDPIREGGVAQPARQPANPEPGRQLVRQQGLVEKLHAARCARSPNRRPRLRPATPAAPGSLPTPGSASSARASSMADSCSPWRSASRIAEARMASESGASVAPAVEARLASAGSSAEQGDAGGAAGRCPGRSRPRAASR